MQLKQIFQRKEDKINPTHKLSFYKELYKYEFLVALGILRVRVDPCRPKKN